MTSLAKQSLAAVVLLALVCLLPAIGHADDAAPPPPPVPDPLLTSDEVIGIQLDALRRAGEDPAAMETVFRFASAGNREATGPLERFDAMVRADPYGVLVGHAEARVSSGALDLKGEDVEPPTTRVCFVRVEGADGRTESFMWMLSRQAEGEPDAGCWMTDFVTPLPELEPEGDAGPGESLV